jgi:hypothetical protein
MWTGLQAKSNFMNKLSEYGEDEQRENDNDNENVYANTHIQILLMLH